MAPSAVETESPQHRVHGLSNNGPVLVKKTLTTKQPLQSSGSLDKYKPDDMTPVIGTEFSDVNLVDLINAPNADQLLRDLAIKSKASQGIRRQNILLTHQSLNAVLFSSESKIISQTIFKSSSSRDLAKLLANLRAQGCTFIRC